MKKPVIGITINEDENNHNYYLRYYYSQVVEKAGGVPLLLPSVEKLDNIYNMVSLTDGLIFSGGVDVDPYHGGEEPLGALGEITPRRDKFELELAKRAVEENRSILAICRGVQLLNIALGGTIYQDLRTQLRTNLIKHSQDAPKWYPTHGVRISKESKLYSLLGAEEVRVNSFHHQAVAKVAEGFKITALAGDGIIEAIESSEHNFIIGVQWHPECMWEQDKKSFRLFKGLIKSINKE